MANGAKRSSSGTVTRWIEGRSPEAPALATPSGTSATAKSRIGRDLRTITSFNSGWVWTRNRLTNGRAGGIGAGQPFSHSTCQRAAEGRGLRWPWSREACSPGPAEEDSPHVAYDLAHRTDWHRPGLAPSS